MPRRRPVILAALALLAARRTARAAWPDHPIHLIVPFSPGGGVDAQARLLAQTLTERVGETVLVENHPGAGSNVGNAFVARAAPDGYTLLMASPSVTINASLYRSLPYDLLKDLVPVAGVAASELLLIVANESPYHTLADLLAAARAKPGKLSYGSAGIGSTEHLAGELMKQLAGIDVLHVPYKGTGQALNDLRGGQIQYMFGGAPGLVPLARDGQVRALAVTSATRPLDLPDIPTMEEGGVPGYVITIWGGVLAPKGTPPDVIAQLNKSITAASHDLADRFASLGSRPMPMSPEQLMALIETQIALWRGVITQANVHVD